MNTPHSPRPGLLCRLVRLRATFAADVSTTRNSRHVQACESCQSWLAAQFSLEQQLTRDSRRMSQQPTPAGLEQFIMAGVRAQPKAGRSEAHGGASRIRLLTFGGALAAGALAAVVLFLRQPVPSPDSGDMVAESELLKPEEVNAMVASVEALPEKLRTNLAPSAARLTQANPLMSEINSVYSDARSALDFLAMNFLPTESAGEVLPDMRDRQG